MAELITPAMMEAVEISENNENPSGCAKCGGMCCKSFPCEVFPQDVKRWFGVDDITAEVIHKLLDSGLVQIDYWDRDVRETEFNYEESFFDNNEYYYQCYYIHMRAGDDPEAYPSWGGRCRALTDKGCAFSWNVRPTGGRSLIPDKDGDFKKCETSIVSKAECVLAWIPYIEILESVYNARYRCYIPGRNDRFHAFLSEKFSSDDEAIGRLTGR